MTALVYVLLAVGVLAVTVSSIGLLAARDQQTRLRVLAPASFLGVPFLVVAVLLARGSIDGTTGKLVAVLVVLMVTTPVATTAISRTVARTGRGSAEDGR